MTDETPQFFLECSFLVSGRRNVIIASILNLSMRIKSANQAFNIFFTYLRLQTASTNRMLPIVWFNRLQPLEIISISFNTKVLPCEKESCKDKAFSTWKKNLIRILKKTWTIKIYYLYEPTDWHRQPVFWCNWSFNLMPKLWIQIYKVQKIDIQQT